MPTNRRIASPPDVVERFTAAIEAASIGEVLFTRDAVLDATVPNWRFTACGAGAVAAELSRWFADPACFETMRRVDIAGGVLLQFDLAWVEQGEPHMCRQAHVLELRDGRIARLTVYCGGRWDSALMAEMGAAAAASQCA